MSIESHIAELERRHAALEAELADALNHPATDALELAALKRRKLQLKDQINKVKVETTIH
jgi:hypothetical protein